MKQRRPWIALLICLTLLILHVVIARKAVVQKNSVYDEPLHTVAGFLVKEHADYRVDKEDGALFLWYGALALNDQSLRISKTNAMVARVLEDHMQQWPFVVSALFKTPRVDGDAVIQRSRLMFLPITFLLGATIGLLAYKLSGSSAAVIATAIYAFDPNFLGHGAIVKNDVMLSLFMLLLSFAMWQIGKRVTIWNVIGAGLICGAGLCVKFSGMLFGPMLVLALIIRICQKNPWKWMNRTATTLQARAALAAVVCSIAIIVSFITIWGVYRFRYLPTNDPQAQFNFERLLWFTKEREVTAQIAKLGVPNAPAATNDEIAAHTPSLLVRTAVWANDHRLLPQAWVAGLIYTHASTQVRATFLLNEYSSTGWWYFFPVAMLVKTPTATLIAVIVAGILVIRRVGPKLDRWTFAVLLLAPSIYFLLAIFSNLNLGLRHILPVYPMLFVLAGVMLSRWLDAERNRARSVIPLLMLGLITETALAYPNYIAFFNTPSDKSVGRLNLLSDSSFDWGQDLITLKRWQDKHPDVHLYFAGFGMYDADFYGLKRTDLPDNRGWTKPEKFDPSRPGVLAISATVMQGTYLDEQMRAVYGSFKNRKPSEILGDTIYLFDVPVK